MLLNLKLITLGSERVHDPHPQLRMRFPNREQCKTFKPTWSGMSITEAAARHDRVWSVTSTNRLAGYWASSDRHNSRTYTSRQSTRKTDRKLLQALEKGTELHRKKCLAGYWARSDRPPTPVPVDSQQEELVETLQYCRQWWGGMELHNTADL